MSVRLSHHPTHHPGKCLRDRPQAGGGGDPYSSTDGRVWQGVREIPQARGSLPGPLPRGELRAAPLPRLQPLRLGSG